MTTTLVVRFVLGRYHATPWGRHVNEGQVELPPSPWRLLRALYAVWKMRLPDLDEATVGMLLTRLAVPPDFFVPPHRTAHTRHYYPDSKHRRSGTPSVDRTLDAFAVVDRESALGVRWKVDLPAEERKALGTLAEALPYLGRADSLCEANVDEAWGPSGRHSLWSAVDVSESIPVDVPAATLLAPTLPLDLDALVLRPVDVRAGKLLFPRSTRFVGYARASLGEPPRPARRPRVGRHRPVEAVRFTVTSRVRPPDTDAVVLTDLLRYSAVHQLSRVRGGARADSRLAGKHADESPMRGHEHAHYLALRDDAHRIGELVVWAPGGLEEDELEAFGRLRVLSPPGEGMPGPRETTVRISGYGEASGVLDDIAGLADRWESATPFVPPRHQKGEWGDFLRKEISRELASRGLPAAEARECDGDWQSFVRYRPTRRFAPRHPDRRPAGRGAFLELVFAEPVCGPVALGHLSHFGLGLFAPVRGG